MKELKLKPINPENGNPYFWFIEIGYKAEYMLVAYPSGCDMYFIFAN